MSDRPGKSNRWYLNACRASYTVSCEHEMIRTILKQFVDEVNRRAEDNMLKTHKLEGSHKAAMDQIMKEIES